MKKILTIIVTMAFLFSISAVVLAADVHSVIAEKPYVLVDGLTGNQYTQLKGFATMNWKDATRYGFFNANVSVTSVLPVVLNYEFQLVSIGNCNDTYIEGLWDIRRNGVLVASGIVGKLEGIDAPVGIYFKFYGGNTQHNTNIWHLSAYVTDRFDF